MNVAMVNVREVRVAMAHGLMPVFVAVSLTGWHLPIWFTVVVMVMVVMTIVLMLMFMLQCLVAVLMFMIFAQVKVNSAAHSKGGHKEGQAYPFMQEKDRDKSPQERSSGKIGAGAGRPQKAQSPDIENQTQAVGQEAKDESGKQDCHNCLRNKGSWRTD